MSKIVVFAQQKGGAGKTTLLVQTAVALSRRKLSVALVDLDPQRSLTRWAELRNDADLSVESASEWQASGAIRRAARAASHVLVDCPGNADVLLRAAVREADLVVIPCQPSAMDAWATAPTLEMCRREKTSAIVVLNRVPPRGGALEAAQRLLAEQDAPLSAATLGNRVAFVNAYVEGKAAAETAPRSTAAAEAEALAAEILSRL